MGYLGLNAALNGLHTTQFYLPFNYPSDRKFIKRRLNVFRTTGPWLKLYKTSRKNIQVKSLEKALKTSKTTSMKFIQMQNLSHACEYLNYNIKNCFYLYSLQYEYVINKFIK